MKNFLFVILFVLLIASCSTSPNNNGGSDTIVLPIAPSNLTGAAISTSNVSLNWLDNSSNETGFKIERRLNGTIQFYVVAIMNADITEFTDSNLTANTSYEYRVCSFNSVGSSITYSNTLILTTLSQSVNQSIYFPPTTSSVWDTTSPASLNWNTTELNNLYPYLQSKNTKAFIILKNGKIVVEKYFGSFTSDSLWYWASAGKTMTAFLVGIAQQEGIININNKTSQYLGRGWTSAPLLKENLITVKNNLTMTTGLDDGVPDDDCTLPSCLIYKSDAGTRWAYHNAAYTVLDSVIINASGMNYNAYFQQKIRNKIGMNGFWYKTPNSNNIYWSNARSMARFGLLLLNRGKWDSTSVLSDTNYFNQQISTSQNLNLSYGYLTWLNGKSSFMAPTLQNIFPGSIIPNAPADLYAALGKNDQKIYVVPSQNLVVIRMGESSGQVQLALSSFDNELWGKLRTIINY